MRMLHVPKIALLCVCLLPLFLAACGGPSVSSPSSLLEPAQAPRTQAVLQTALSQLGTSYTYGGCDPKHGFDCSGYTWWVFGQHGIALPRTTSRQIHAGAEIPQNRLQPADLVFFGFRHGLHVGIHLGNGKFIHSPKSGGVVRVESLRTGFWASRLVAVRRVLK